MVADRKPKSAWPDAHRRPSRAEYPTWLDAVHGVDVIKEKNRYESALDRVVSAATNGPFWSEFEQQREDLAAAYRSETGFNLFAFPRDERPQGKTWESFLLKSFRRNVLDNPAFPSQPTRGWLLPNNWLTEIHDVTRTVLVVKYLDGVQFLTDALQNLAVIAGATFSSDLQARDTGYYAAHTYSTYLVDLPDADWNMQRYTMSLEVQITTQLQEVMSRLTHKEYERRRELPASASLNWQWDYSSDAFQPNYLGHILHYAEGMIMEVRNRDRT